jgi:hypothetical protein
MKSKERSEKGFNPGDKESRGRLENKSGPFFLPMYIINTFDIPVGHYAIRGRPLMTLEAG